MTTGVLEKLKPKSDVISDSELEEMFKNDPPCSYICNGPNGKPIEVCDKPATWAAFCRKCGHPSLLCEDHYIYFNLSQKQRNGRTITCRKCRTTCKEYVELYMMVHKI